MSKHVIKFHKEKGCIYYYYTDRTYRKWTLRNYYTIIWIYAQIIKRSLMPDFFMNSSPNFLRICMETCHLDAFPAHWTHSLGRTEIHIFFTYLSIRTEFINTYPKRPSRFEGRNRNAPLKIPPNRSVTPSAKRFRKKPKNPINYVIYSF